MKLVRWFLFFFATAYLLGVSGQAADVRSSYRQAIRGMDPMNAEGMDPNLAFVLQEYYEWTFQDPDTWDALSSIRFDGLLHLAGGSVRFVAFKKKPDYCKVVIFTGSGSRIVMAFDGQDAWTLDTSQAGAQPVEMPEKEAADFIRDATTAGHLLYPKMEGKQIKTLGITNVDDWRCYEMEVMLPDGSRMLSYLDTSNLTERRQITVNSVSGQREETTFSDFRRVEGIRFPFASIKESGGEILHRVEMKRIQLNLGIMPWMFQRPSGAYIPGESASASEFDLFDTKGDSPAGLDGFPLQKHGQSAFPDPEPIEKSSLLDDLGNSLFE